MQHTFRDALVGVWCLSWHPGSDDVCLEPLDAVVRNNLVSDASRRKAVLAVLGHADDDRLTLEDPMTGDLQGLDARAWSEHMRLARKLGWTPTWFPVGLESAERWHWLVHEGGD